jgi:hypothetical protein
MRPIGETLFMSFVQSHRGFQSIKTSMEILGMHPLKPV